MSGTDIQKNALVVLINGLNLACKRGAFSLDEAAELNKAVKIFQVPINETASPNVTQTSQVANGSSSTQ